MTRMKLTFATTCLAMATGLLLLTAAGPSQAQVAAGPAAWSSNQTWAADTVNGASLTGYYYWPAAQPALAGKRALVLVLHGCQQSAAGDVIASASDQGFNWKAAADQYGAVILAPNATGNVYGNHCWDYASTRHNRTSGHDAILLNLIDRFVGDARYGIDPNQVYVTGLSSGGGETMALGCLAPDIFAGVGINAGPPPGTTTAQISYVPAGFTAGSAAARCSALAGNQGARFSSQVTSVIWGNNDYTVSQAYGPMDAAAMRQVYGGSFTQSSAAAVAGGGSEVRSTDSAGKLRTSEITVAGMGHAWPAGSGGQNSNYVDASKVNYPAFLMAFWFANNLRVTTTLAPRMTACSANVAGNTVTISGAATDAGAIASYQVQLTGATSLSDPAAGAGASFSKPYAASNGYSSASVTAISASSGLTSAPCAIGQFLVGPAPALPAPAGLAVSAASASTISLGWHAVAGASGYHLYRNGARQTAQPLSASAYLDSALAAGTSYSYQVSALNGSGESALSAALSASTTTGYVCTAISASNYAHVQAGRAHASGGYALANGSNQSMGLYNLFYTSSLAQTAAGYYQVGACP